MRSECLARIRPYHKDEVAIASPKRVEHGVVEECLPVRSDRRKLLPSTESRRNPRGQYDEGWGVRQRRTLVAVTTTNPMAMTRLRTGIGVSLLVNGNATRRCNHLANLGNSNTPLSLNQCVARNLSEVCGIYISVDDNEETVGGEWMISVRSGQYLPATSRGRRAPAMERAATHFPLCDGDGKRLGTVKHTCGRPNVGLNAPTILLRRR